MKRIIFIGIFSLLLTPSLVLSQKKVPAATKSDDTIFPVCMNELKADEKFFASDELEGRETGARGIKIAALYLKTQFEKLGLRPVNNSYYQKLEVLKTSPAKNPVLSIQNAKGEINAEFKKDFFPHSIGKAADKVSSKIVFAGYGISSQEHNFDDYKDIDVKDKIVLIIANSPRENDYSSPFGGIKKSEPYKNFNMKAENAFKHGAAGVLYMMETGKRTLSMYVKSFGRFIDKPGYKLLTTEETESIPFTYISKEFTDKILSSTNYTIDILRNKIDSTFTPLSFEIPGTSAIFKPSIKREMLETENVAGYLEGNDPALKEQCIVFSCHYDHLGKQNDGKIFNGADDDASGTAAILDIAKAIVKSNEKPSRSFLFLAFTGEEKGLFGSNYYAENPLIPFKNTYLDLNIDMIGRIDEKYIQKGDSNYLYIIGPKIMGGNIEQLLEQFNRESVNLTLDYEYDNIKDPNIFYRRSDHYNFAKNNVPSIFFYNGEHKDYHKLTDKIDKINFDIFLKRVKMIGYSGLKFANSKNQIKAERAFP